MSNRRQFKFQYAILINLIFERNSFRNFINVLWLLNGSISIAHHSAIRCSISFKITCQKNINKLKVERTESVGCFHCYLPRHSNFSISVSVSTHAFRLYSQHISYSLVLLKYTKMTENSHKHKTEKMNRMAPKRWRLECSASHK